MSSKDETPTGLSLSRRTLLAGLGAAPVALSVEAEARAPAPDVEAAPAVAPTRPPEDILAQYLASMRAVQRAHRRMQDLVKDELERCGYFDISGAEGFLLLNIGDGNKDAHALRGLGWAGDRRSFHRMLERLVTRGLLLRSQRGRTLSLALSDEGRKVAAIISAGMNRHVASIRPIGGVTTDQLADAGATLYRLERFWTDTILYRL